MRVFIDTSAFCALTIPKDQHNQRAKTVYRQIQKEKSIIFTSDFVLDEVYTLLKNRDCHATAVNFMNQFEKCGANVLRITENIEASAKIIFKKFDERKLSFTDCTSFALINHSGIEGVFAFDDHFKYHPYRHLVKLFA